MADNPLRAALSTLGCRVNFAETDQLRGRLLAAGYCLVEFEQEAEVYIVNTCTVTHVADRKSRQLLRRAARRHPGALVVAVGCYADVAPTALATVEGVDLVLDRGEEPLLVERIAAALRSRGIEPPAPAATAHAELTPAHPARALVKVQDGCDNRCAYCIVSIARGPSRSRPADEVLAEVRHVAQAGYPEIILTGINLGMYRDPAIGGLVGLARRILEETSIGRIRFSSIEPQDFPLDLLELWPNPRLCRHFHLPLQSGSDRTLARMRRRYRLQDFRTLVGQICERIPDAGLTTDLIVGFPGESDEEFAEGMAAVAALPLSELHIFPFSIRPGTAAARMPDPVPDGVRQARLEEMHRLAEQMARSFRDRFIGRELDVLWDGRCRNDWSGLSDNYVRVLATAPGDWLGRVTRTRITGLEGTTLRGEIIAPPGETPPGGSSVGDDKGKDLEGWTAGGLLLSCLGRAEVVCLRDQVN